MSCLAVLDISYKSTFNFSRTQLSPFKIRIVTIGKIHPHFKVTNVGFSSFPLFEWRKIKYFRRNHINVWQALNEASPHKWGENLTLNNIAFIISSSVIISLSTKPFSSSVLGIQYWCTIPCLFHKKIEFITEVFISHITSKNFNLSN